MIDSLNLQSYGIAGIFITYLIYDRQIIVKKLILTIEANTTATKTFSDKIYLFNKLYKRR